MEKELFVLLCLAQSQFILTEGHTSWHVLANKQQLLFHWGGTSDWFNWVLVWPLRSISNWLISIGSELQSLNKGDSAFCFVHKCCSTQTCMLVHTQTRLMWIYYLSWLKMSRYYVLTIFCNVEPHNLWKRYWRITFM